MKAITQTTIFVATAVSLAVCTAVTQLWLLALPCFACACVAHFFLCRRQPAQVASAAGSEVDILAFCEARRLDLEARVKLFETVCDTVRLAHEQGLVLDELEARMIKVTDQGGAFLVEIGGLAVRDHSMKLSVGDMSSSWGTASEKNATVSRVLNVFQLGQLLHRLVEPWGPNAGVHDICSRATSVRPDLRFASAAELHGAVSLWLQRRVALRLRAARRPVL